MSDLHHDKVSIILQDFIDTHTEESLPIGTLVHAFGERGMAFMLLVFALICAIPLPDPRHPYVFVAAAFLYQLLSDDRADRSLAAKKDHGV